MRMEFVRQHKEWTNEDWNKIIWTDEKKFVIFPSGGREYYWKKRNGVSRPHHVKPKIGRAHV